MHNTPASKEATPIQSSSSFLTGRRASCRPLDGAWSSSCLVKWRVALVDWTSSSESSVCSPGQLSNQRTTPHSWEESKTACQSLLVRHFSQFGAHLIAGGRRCRVSLNQRPAALAGGDPGVGSRVGPGVGSGVGGGFRAGSGVGCGVGSQHLSRSSGLLRGGLQTPSIQLSSSQSSSSGEPLGGLLSGVVCCCTSGL